MTDKQPEPIKISPKAAKKLRQAGGKLPEGKEGDNILAAIIRKLKS